jgi:hypothetical protein
MKKSIIILCIIIFALISSGCIEAPDSTIQIDTSSPRGVILAYSMTHDKKDYDTMYTLLSTEIKESTPLETFRKNIENDDEELSRQGFSYSYSSILNENINGDQARVEIYYKMTSDSSLLKTERMTLVLEESGWKFTEIPSKI